MNSCANSEVIGIIRYLPATPEAKYPPVRKLIQWTLCYPRKNTRSFKALAALSNAASKSCWATILGILPLRVHDALLEAAEHAPWPLALKLASPCSAPYLTLRNVGFPGVVGGVGSSGELVAGAMAFSRGPAGVAAEPVLTPASNDMP